MRRQIETDDKYLIKEAQSHRHTQTRAISKSHDSDSGSGSGTRLWPLEQETRPEEGEQTESRPKRVSFLVVDDGSKRAVQQLTWTRIWSEEGVEKNQQSECTCANEHAH